MQNKKIIGTIAIVIVVAGLSFWGGMTYTGKNIKAANANRQGAFAQNGGVRSGTGMRGGAGGGLVSGKVLSIDATSMTVQLGNGGPAGAESGSKIIFFSPTTKIEKSVSGSVSDVVVGNQVLVTGAANSDGSVNAASIQLRPATVAGATTTIPAR